MKRIALGRLGERIAERFLIAKGHEVLQRNFKEGYGEIDLVTKKGEKIHFIEVKTVSRESNDGFYPEFVEGVYPELAEGVYTEPVERVSRETYRPEDNVHQKKIRTIARTGEYFMLKYGHNEEWQIDVVAIELHVKQKSAKVRHIENIS